MKKIFLLLLTLTLTNTLWAEGGNTGGMDGGGGGTLPTEPVSIFTIQSIAEESKQQLLYLFNYYEYLKGYSSKNSLFQKLFGGTRKVQEVLKDLRLEVRTDKPCYTAKGTEVDASIYAQKSNTICLSAFRISKKVDKVLAEREVTALLMHEVSHFLGTNEEEALDLQKEIARFISDSKSDSKLKEAELRYEFSHFQSQLSSGIDFLEKNQLTKAKEQLSIAIDNLQPWQFLASSAPYMFFGIREQQYQDLLGLKLLWATTYLATLIDNCTPVFPGCGFDRADAQDRYNKIFKDRNFFFAYEDAIWESNHLYRNEKIYKLQSVPELILLLNEIQKEYHIRGAYSYQATFGMRWLNLDGHLTAPAKNPWENFMGTYSVQSVQCDFENKNTNEVQFKIEKLSDKLYITRIFPSASMTDLIELGAYNVNTYLNNYGTTPDRSVFMTHEYGGSWSQRMFVDTKISDFRLKTNPDKTFEITRTDSYFPRDITQADSVHTCVYKGIISH